MRHTLRDRARLSTVAEALVVFAIALVASILWTWPLVLHLAKGGRSPLDSPFEAWTIDWVQYAIRHPRHLYDADIFAPTRGTLAFSAPLIGVALPTMPLRWLGMSPMAIYNASQILATSFSAAGAYLLGRMVLGRRAAAAVVGFAFAFGPVPYAVSLQLQATARAGIPLAAAATWWLADRAESNRSLYPPAIALALVLAWQTSVSLYPAAYAVVAMFVVLAVRWRVVPRRGVVVAALAGLLAVVVCAIPQLVFAHAYRDAAPKEPGDYGASFVQAAPRLWYPKLLDWKGPAVLIVSAGFPGITLLAMAVVGAVWMPRARVRTLGLVATAVGAVMALGAASHGWRRFTPYRLVLLVVPLAGALREYARAWTLGLLGLGVLAGGALLRLDQRSRRIASLVATAACVCIALEGFAPWTDVTPASIHPVDVALSKLPGSGGVLYLPIASTRRASTDLSFFVQPDIVFRTTAHHRPTVNGYSAYFPPWSGTAVDLAAKLRCASARRALYEAGVRFVVSAPYLPISAVGLRQLGRYGNEVLYELLAPSRRRASC